MHTSLRTYLPRHAFRNSPPPRDKRQRVSPYLNGKALLSQHMIRQENNWGGGDSERKAALLEEELMNLFKTKKEIYKDEVRETKSVYLVHPRGQCINSAFAGAYTICRSSSSLSGLQDDTAVFSFHTCVQVALLRYDTSVNVHPKTRSVLQFRNPSEWNGDPAHATTFMSFHTLTPVVCAWCVCVRALACFALR